MQHKYQLKSTSFKSLLHIKQIIPLQFIVFLTYIKQATGKIFSIAFYHKYNVHKNIFVDIMQFMSLNPSVQRVTSQRNVLLLGTLVNLIKIFERKWLIEIKGNKEENPRV